MKSLLIVMTSLLILLAIPGGDRELAVSSTEHEVRATVVSVDVTARLIVFRDQAGTTHTVPVLGNAIELLKSLRPGEKVALSVQDNEMGEHEGVSKITRLGPEAAPMPLPRPSPRPSPGGEKNYAKVQVFYATDRLATGDAAPARFYSGKRRGDELLAYGTLEVSIPRYHTEGELESPKWWKLEFREDPGKHVVLLSVVEHTAEDFYSGLKSRVGDSARHEALVFIHGFNVTFEDAARRTAQMSYDLAKLSGTPPQFAPAPILYSWPSAGEVTAIGYEMDQEAVMWTVPHLKRFLEEIAARSGATTIHIVAHSMGNRALVNALDQIAKAGEPRPVPHFRQLVLAAPDIDAAIFRQLSASFISASDRVTLYASSKDEALSLSDVVHGGMSRAGESGDQVVVLDGVDTVDASQVKTGLLGHSYYGESPSILKDLLLLLKDGTAPAQRPSLTPVPNNGKQYWSLNP